MEQQQDLVLLHCLAQQTLFLTLLAMEEDQKQAQAQAQKQEEEEEKAVRNKRKMWVDEWLKERDKMGAWTTRGGWAESAWWRQ